MRFIANGLRHAINSSIYIFYILSWYCLIIEWCPSDNYSDIYFSLTTHLNLIELCLNEKNILEANKWFKKISSTYELVKNFVINEEDAIKLKAIFDRFVALDFALNFQLDHDSIKKSIQMPKEINSNGFFYNSSISTSTLSSVTDASEISERPLKKLKTA